jgi:hypothetical protein
MDKLLFQLGDAVQIAASDERGTVIGRAQYLNAEPAYLLRYKCADGRAIESWWTQQALEAVPEGEVKTR